MRYHTLGVVGAMASMTCHAAGRPADSNLGVISLWRNRAVPGGVRVFANGTYIGGISDYALTGKPACGGTQTLNFTHAGGTVTIVAVASGGRLWTVVTTAQRGGCKLVLLPG